MRQLGQHRRQHRHPVERRAPAPLAQPRRRCRRCSTLRRRTSAFRSRSLSASNGVISGGGKTVTYGQLVGGKLFNAKIATANLNPGQGDLEAGEPVQGHRRRGAARRPSCEGRRHVHLRAQHPRPRDAPRSRRASARAGRRSAPALRSSRSTRGRSATSPDARVVRQGDFLGVVAPREYDAIQAASQLKVTWKESPILPTPGGLFKQMRAQDAAGPRQGGVHGRTTGTSTPAWPRRRRRSRRPTRTRTAAAR